MSEAVVVSVALQLSRKAFEFIKDSVTDYDATDADKVGSVALGALIDMAEGGLMMLPVHMRRLTETYGEIPTPEQIVEQFEQGCGRKDGRFSYTITLDPQHEPFLREIAENNGIAGVQRFLQQEIDRLCDEGYFAGVILPAQDRLILPPGAREELVKALGEFDNGAQFTELVKKKCGVPEEVGVFGD